MTGKPGELEAARAIRREQYLTVELPKLRARVRAEVERRGLASFMNRTRWEALCAAVYAELPFPPPFQLQSVLGERESLWDSDEVDYWGDWGGESLEPLVSIEWLRVVPRYRKHVGMLVPDEVVDASDQFRALLVRLAAPCREDDRGFWIYGYASADPATLTPPVETPT